MFELCLEEKKEDLLFEEAKSFLEVVKKEDELVRFMKHPKIVKEEKMKTGKNILIRVTDEHRKYIMKRLWLIPAVFMTVVCGGCKENLPPASPEKEKVLETPLQCRKCRKTYLLKECKRINQVLFNCPNCNQVINAAKSKVNKK